MTDRIRWTCPFCSKTYAVPSIEGLTACPACDAEDAAAVPTTASGLGMSERVVVSREIVARLAADRPKPILQRPIPPGTGKLVALGILTLSSAFLCWTAVSTVGKWRSEWAATAAKERDAALSQKAEDDARNQREVAAYTARIAIEPQLGDRLVLKSKEGAVFLMPTTADWNELAQCSARKDSLGLQQMLLGGRLFAPPNGTTAQLLRGGIEGYEVRILDGPLMGQRGWVNKLDASKQ